MIFKSAKMLAICLTVLLVVGCERSEIAKTAKPLEGGENRQWEVLCIDGVEYISRSAGYRAVLSVKFRRDGNVSICGN